jgi:hypothetical protein
MAMANNHGLAANPNKNKKVASFVTTAVALEIVGLFGVSYVTDAYGPLQLMAATTIFIDGTKDILPTNDSQAADRMRDTLSGAYDQCGAGSTGSCAQNVYIDYSRDFGILTGGVGYDQSKAEATTKTIAAIRLAQQQNPGDTVYVVGYSQGANATSDVIKRAHELNLDNDPTNDLDLSNVTLVMVGNGARNDGGLWARLPAGVYVPLLGLSFGASTDPTTGPGAAGQVLMITKQYDGAADWPRYVLVNPLAAVNAALGFVYVHNGYYKDVDISDLDTNADGKLSQAEITAGNASGKYVINQNGNVVDVLVKNQPGDMPIEQPLRALGVPESVILALDPILRAIVDAGYQRPTNGIYPAQPVHFGLIPDPAKMFADFLAIEAAFGKTAQDVNPLPACSASPEAPSTQGASLAAFAASGPSSHAPALVAVEQEPHVVQHASPGVDAAPLVVYQAPPVDEQTSPIVDATPPIVDAAPPIVDAAPPTRELPVESATPSGGSTTVAPRGPIGGSPNMPGLKNIVTAVNGVVTATVTALTNALTPPSKGAGGAASSGATPPAAPPPAAPPAAAPPASPPSDPGTP